MVGAALLAWAAGFGKRWLRNAVIALYVFLTERRHMPALPWYRKLWFAVTFPLFDVIGRISTVIALFSHVGLEADPARLRRRDRRDADSKNSHLVMRRLFCYSDS
mgnify:CR=1 FL=1